MLLRNQKKLLKDFRYSGGRRSHLAADVGDARSVFFTNPESSSFSPRATGADASRMGLGAVDYVDKFLGSR